MNMETQNYLQEILKSNELESETLWFLNTFKNEDSYVWNKYKNDVEYNYLQQLLVAADRDITEACRMSGLSRARIYQLISKHNL